MTADVRKESLRVLIVYSTRTGNTEFVARGVGDRLVADDSEVDAEIVVSNVTEKPDPSGFDVVILAFWVDRGTADQETLSYLEAVSGTRIGLIGTLGAYPDSQHAKDVEERMREAVSAENTVVGCFLCQGRIDPRLTEKFKSFPADHPHAMTPERAKRHQDASTHPDETDVQNAAKACHAMLAGVGA